MVTSLNPKEWRRPSSILFVDEHLKILRPFLNTSTSKISKLKRYERGKNNEINRGRSACSNSRIALLHHPRLALIAGSSGIASTFHGSHLCDLI